MAHMLVHIPHLGHSVCLVNRELLRRRTHGKTFQIPWHLKGVLQGLPTPPTVFSWTKSNSVQLPILGNNQYGDCYYAAVCHAVQVWTANTSMEAVFDAAAVIARYLKLSGGDNGLGDSQIMPEWKSGIVGPNGPHKILDEMTVNPNDDASTALAMYRFYGLIYTAALPNAWLVNPMPGNTWDKATPDQNNGHAMLLTGKNVKGGYDLQTWGFNPPVNLTPAGLKGSDPELIVAFSLEMYNAQGISPCGTTYADDAALWVQCGGKTLPPSPFAPPVPTPPVPVPPGPNPMPTVQQMIDAFFAALEAKYAAIPWFGIFVTTALEAVRKYIDSLLTQSQNAHLRTRYYAVGVVSAVPPEIMAIVDAAFMAAIQDLPVLAPILRMLKQLTDTYLPLL